MRTDVWLNTLEDVAAFVNGRRDLDPGGVVLETLLGEYHCVVRGRVSTERSRAAVRSWVGS